MAGFPDSLKDEQQVVEMEVEGVKKDLTGSGIDPVSSAYASWTRSAMIRKFWRLYLTGLMVSIGGMYVLPLTSPAITQYMPSM